VEGKDDIPLVAAARHKQNWTTNYKTDLTMVSAYLRHSVKQIFAKSRSLTPVVRAVGEIQVQDGRRPAASWSRSGGAQWRHHRCCDSAVAPAPGSLQHNPTDYNL
jgi:hypothetical protein